MAAKEMYDYLSIVSPDSNYTLLVNPQRVLTEDGTKNQEVHIADDGSEETLSLSTNSIFYIVMQWNQLTSDNAGTILDFYHDTNKGDGVTKSFKWAHPTDGHTYVIRFDQNPKREIAKANIHGIASIRFRVLGRILDVVEDDDPIEQSSEDINLTYSVNSYTEANALPVLPNGAIVNIAWRSTAGDGGGGTFVCRTGDFSSEIAADTQQGIYISNGASTCLVRQHNGLLDICWFGAIGNGIDANASGNMVAIQAAINLASFFDKKGVVVIPIGDFRINPTKTLYIALQSDVHIIGFGRNSLLKLINNAGDFNKIFGSDGTNGAGTRISNVIFYNMRIDWNPSNNATHTFDRYNSAATDFFQFGIVLYRYHNIIVDRVFFEPYCGVNAVTFNNVSSTEIDSEITVQNCFFQFERLSNATSKWNTSYYDNTAAYLKGSTIKAVSNTFYSQSISNYAFGSIEIHGGTAIIEKNTSINYTTLCDIVGDADWSENTNVVVSCNIAIGANAPIRFVPIAATTPTTGIQNVIVSNNTLNILQKSWGRYFWGGIISNSNDGFLRNIVIEGNSLIFESDTTSRTITDVVSGTSFSQEDTYAIGFKPPTTNPFALEGITIKGNTIKNSPGASIALGKSSTLSICKGVNVGMNTIINSGTYQGISDDHRCGIRLKGVFTGGNISNNIIQDIESTGILGKYSIYTTGTFTDTRFVHNTITAANGTYLDLYPLSGVLFDDMQKFNTFSDGDQTPSVRGGKKFWKTGRTTLASLTNFDDGIEGQELVIVGADGGNSQIYGGNPSNIKTQGNTTFRLYDGDTITLIKVGSTWVEKSRSDNTP